jgi:hypothetical protein
VTALLNVAVSVIAFGNAAVQFALLFQFESEGEASQVALAAVADPTRHVANVREVSAICILLDADINVLRRGFMGFCMFLPVAVLVLWVI